ncbi:hypothetical protein pb186bvf_001234 [Paramecium bursaria]
MKEKIKQLEKEQIELIQKLDQEYFQPRLRQSYLESLLKIKQCQNNLTCIELQLKKQQKPIQAYKALLREFSNGMDDCISSCKYSLSLNMDECYVDCFEKITDSIKNFHQ